MRPRPPLPLPPPPLLMPTLLSPRGLFEAPPRRSRLAVPPGAHGAHVHTVGRCDPLGFESAGGHWNPTGAKHGANNPAGPHLGDLPNMTVGADGRGTVSFTVPGATMDGLLDADGATMMVHANADDLVTDPSGNSGGRIACGVFQAG